MSNAPSDVRDSVRAYLRSQLANGFRTHDRILEEADELFADEIDSAAVKVLLSDVLREYQADQATWAATTDCDRLDAAFDELNERGIMARHDWWCCDTCGAGAMPDEYQRVVAQDPTLLVRGYTFYNNQATEGAADGSALHLAYGAVEPGEEAALAIARTIVETLQRHGLTVHWNGSYSRKIGVSLIWRRRAPPTRWTES